MGTHKAISLRDKSRRRVSLFSKRRADRRPGLQLGSRSLRIENLEVRTLLSAGTITWAGGANPVVITSGNAPAENDTLTISLLSSPTRIHVVDTNGNTYTTAIPGATGSGSGNLTILLGAGGVTSGTSLDVNTGDSALLGTDSLTVDLSNGNPSAAPLNGTINFTSATGAKKLVVNESTLGSADTLTVTNAAITGTALGLTVNYSTTGSFAGGVVLDTGGVGATVNVKSTLAGGPTNIVSGTADVVNVTNAGSVQGILGTLNIECVPSFNTIVVDDSADATGRTATLSSFTSNPDDSQANADAYGKIHLLAPADINYEYGDTLGITIDGGSGGNVFNVQATGTTTQLNTGSGNDTVNVTGAGATLNIDGGLPAFPSIPGDTLNVPSGSVVVPSGTGSGSVTGYVTSYTSIETVGGGPYTLNIATANFGVANNGIPDSVKLILNGAELDVYVNGVLVGEYAYASVGAIIVTGSNDDDTLIVDNSGGLITPAGGITFHGNSGPLVGGENNVLDIQGDPGAAQAVSQDTYTVGATPDKGTEVLTSTIAGVSESITFDKLAPINNVTPAAVYDIILSAGADTATVQNGPIFATFQTDTVFPNSGTFETVNFANKITANVNGNNGGDTIILNYTIQAVGLNTLQAFGAGSATSLVVDAAANDLFYANNTAAGVLSNNLFGQGGNDDFTNEDAPGNFNMTGLLSPVSVDGGTGTNDFAFSDTLSATAQTFALDKNGGGQYELTSTGWSTITYTNLANFYIEGSAGNDTMNVLDTAAGTAYIVNGDGGSDEFTIGNTAANFDANTYNGTLANILGRVTVFADYNSAAGANDTLNVDASSDLNLAGAASISNLGTIVNGPYKNQFPATIFSSPTTRLANFAGVDIDYAHGDILPTALSNRLENLNVRASKGADTINVNDTTATLATTVEGMGGDDTMNIVGDNLSAANTFHGDTASGAVPPGGNGNDTFFLNVAANLGAAAVYGPTSSLAIEGDGTAAANTDTNRNQTIVNDNSGTARSLNFQYTDATKTSGNLDIAPTIPGSGLGGGVSDIPVNIVTMQTVIFNTASAGTNNDAITITGTTANDKLTVAELPTTTTIGFGSGTQTDDPTLLPNGTVAGASVTAFLDGTPYRNAPPTELNNTTAGDNDLPGVSGLGSGPDLLINGIAGVLTMIGGGKSGVAGTGDQAIVYAASEGNLVDTVGGSFTTTTNPGAADIFGLGQGVLQAGFGTIQAYDTVNASDTGATISNNFAGSLVSIALDTASFVQGPLGPSVHLASEQPGFIINGGDEAAPQASGIADEFTVTVSTNFNIQVNGNLPTLTTVNGVPQGDQLNASFPGSINVFSDDATPPNVTITGQTVSGGSPFGVKYSSIERVNLTPGNGIVNIIGDNDVAGKAQNDYFKVRGGIDPLGSVVVPDENGNQLVPATNGMNQFSLQIGGSWHPTTGGAVGNPDSGLSTQADGLSSKIYFFGVTRINASGGAITGFDTHGNALPDNASAAGNNALDITPYADNTPKGWGIETYWDQANPAARGGDQNTAADLLVFNGVLGVSENIVVQPSALQAGQVFDNNAATNTPIAVVNYTVNTNVIVNGSSPAGTAGDTDALTIRGTDAANPGTSGNEDVIADFSALGDATHPMVRVYDAGAVLPAVRPTAAEVADTTGILANVIYSLQDFSNFNTLTIQTLTGSDVISMIGRVDGSLNVNLDTGLGNDTLILPGVNNGSDKYVVTPGAASDAGSVAVTRSAATGATTVSYTGLEALTLDGGGGTGADSITLNGTGANDQFTVTAGGVGATTGTAQVNAGPATSFTNLGSSAGTALVLGSPGGSDAFALTQAATGPIPTVTVNGGATSSVTITGTSATDTFKYTPSSANSATVVVNGVGGTSYGVNGTTSLSIDGAANTNTLTVTPTNAVITPGSSTGTGTVTATAAGGQALLPLHYANITTATVSGGTLVVLATEDDDTVSIDTAGNVTVLNRSTGATNTYSASGYAALVIDAAGDNDLVNISASVQFAGGIQVFGDSDAMGSNSGTVVTFTGDAAAAVTVDLGAQTVQEGAFGAVTFTGITTLNVLNGSGAVTVKGSAGVSDAFVVTPLTGTSAAIQDNGLNPLVVATTSGLLTIDPLGGVDNVTVNGTSGNDAILATVALNPLNTQVTVNALVPVNIVTADTASLVLAGGTGNDVLSVLSTTTAPVTIPMTYDGGPGTNALVLLGGTATSDTYTPGSQPGAGTETLVFGVNGTETVHFMNLAPVFNSVAGPLVVNGTNAANAINYAVGFSNLANFLSGTPSTTWGQVSVDSFEPVEFQNKTTLTINGLAGSDEINLNNPNALAGLTGITVNGGDPTASDKLVVNGTTSPDTVNITPDPAATDGGSVTLSTLPTVTFTGTEALVYNGQGGNDLLTVTVPAASTTTYTPGATLDAASLQVNGPVHGLVPVSFTNLGVAGAPQAVQIAAGAASTLVYNGTANNDTFTVTTVAGPKGNVLLNSQLPVQTNANVTTLTLNGLAGDNTFKITSTTVTPQYTTINVNGSGLADPDVVNLTGNGVAAATATLPGNSTAVVTGGGLGTVNISGAGTVNLTTGAAGATVADTGSNNTLVVTPTATHSASSQIEGQVPVVNTTSTGALAVTTTINGSDQLEVVGTQYSDTIAVNGGLSQVQVVNLPQGTLQQINFDANVASLVVNGLAGNDTFNVTPSLNMPISIDGGDPIGISPPLAPPNGDQINIIAGGNPVSFSQGPEADQGSFVVDADQPVSFIHIERAGVTGAGPGPGGGPAVTINGSSEDDDITVTAIDASNQAQYGAVGADGMQDFAVQMNDALTVFFIDTPSLLVNGLAGDDDIVVDAPAPGNENWNVAVTIDGGAPSAHGGTLGDTVAVETTGTAAQTVSYTPSGVNAGTVGLSTITSSVALINVENLTLNGNENNDLFTLNGTAGADAIAATPGPTTDSGKLQVNNLLGITYQDLGAAATVTVNGGALSDTLTVNSTPALDTFNVASTGAVTLNNDLPIQVTAVENLVLNGFHSNDIFNIHGGLPYTTTRVNGLDPTASDPLNLIGASAAVTVNLADPAVPTDTTVTGYGGTIIVTGVDVVNLDVNSHTLTVNGTVHDDVITYAPSGANAGKFQAAGLNSVFNFTAATGTFTITGGVGAVGTVGNTDNVIVQGTNSRDLFQIDQGLRTVQVLAFNVNPLKAVTLDATIQVLTAVGLQGQDTFQVIPAPGVAAFTGDASGINNLLINVDGGSGPSGENNALVVQAAGGAALPATTFVVVNRGSTAASGTVRTYSAAVQQPDINYVNVQVVSPNVASPGGLPNLLIMGPDLNEPNEFQANATFLGSGATLQVQYAAIFPNSSEFPGVVADHDFYQVVAQTTGTLDFQVYFKLYPGLLPAGGNLALEVRDGAGLVVGKTATVAVFGTVGATANARIRVPVVAGQSYYLHVFGANANGTVNPLVVNGYNATIINTAPPVPTDVELSRSVPPPVAGNPDTGDLPATAPGDDTGRSQFDNVTKVNNPTIFLRLDDAIFLQDLPGNQTAGGVPPMGKIAIPFNASTALAATTAGFRIALYDGGNGAPPAGAAHTLDPNDSTFLGFAQPVAGVPHLYSLKIGSQGPDSLADGLHHLTARVQIIDPANPTQSGFGDRSAAQDIVVDTVPPPVSFGGLLPSSDSGIDFNQATLTDRITNDLTPGFWGTAEADAVIRVYVDAPELGFPTGNGVFNPAVDFQVAMTTAIPLDGTNAYPNGHWEANLDTNLNALPFPVDGLRRFFVTAEDLAGNVNPTPPQTAQQFVIFIDTEGPQVTNVQINDLGNPYNIFTEKPTNAPQGPTPLVNSLVISFQDLPPRLAAFLYNALKPEIAAAPGIFQVKGDANGIIPILDIIVINNPPVAGMAATATVELVFREPGPDGVFNTADDIGMPLPDDRFTLTISDELMDPVGNHLDGESNASEPPVTPTRPTFPSGDGVPGGDFVARFTVDSRPEIGTWSGGNVYVDTNGNFTFDPTNLDATNRDLVYTLGYASDKLFAGNFGPAYTNGGALNGFSKLAAYGKVGTQYRWLFTNDAGQLVNYQVEPNGINGLPVAGNFTNDPADGDQVGLFDGKSWYLDTNNDSFLDTVVPSQISGYPIVGDFNGDGLTDLGTYLSGTFSFQLGTGLGSFSPAVETIALSGDPALGLGVQLGALTRPAAADMNQDGITDIGVYVPDGAGATATPGSEWFWLISTRPSVDELALADPLVALNHTFSPTPLGNDLFAKFGNSYAMPIVGNFDPPVTPAGTPAAPSAPLMLNLTGTAGNDNFQFARGSQAGTWSVTLNGKTQTLVASSIQVNFDGHGGKDTAVLHGSGSNQQLVMRPGSADLSGPGYTVHVVAASITADPGGGSGVASLYGATGKKDYFTADPASALMSDSLSTKWTYSNRETGYGTVNAYSAAGESDQATLNGAANDVFNAYATHAQYSHNTVYNFRYVTANGKPGSVANLYASVATDKFVGSPTSATLSGLAFSNQAVGFKEVEAYGVAGGKNSAQITDAGVKSRLQTGMGVAKLTSLAPKTVDYVLGVNSFASVTATLKNRSDTKSLAKTIDFLLKVH